MPAVLETTVHDMKTHFSQYSAELLAGKYDEIIVKRRATPTLRILHLRAACHRRAHVWRSVEKGGIGQ